MLDLREQHLPFFSEPVPPLHTGGRFTEPRAETWRARLARYDGFIATVAEYNHGPTAELKNALDNAHLEWELKADRLVGLAEASAGHARSKSSVESQ